MRRKEKGDEGRSKWRRPAGGWLAAYCPCQAISLLALLSSLFAVGISTPAHALTISNIQATDIGDAGALITWSTDENATTEVNFGTDTTYGYSFQNDASSLTTHWVGIGGMPPGTVIHYQAKSVHISTVTAPDQTFTTLAETNPMPQLPTLMDTTLPVQAGALTYLNPTTCGAKDPHQLGLCVQNALEQAQYGDTLMLQAGTTYSFANGLILPMKNTGSGWIEIRSDAPDDKLPAPGHRINPSYDAYMPKLIAEPIGAGHNYGLPIIVTPDNQDSSHPLAPAHHYRLIGLEIGYDPAVTLSYEAVIFGGAGSEQTNLSQVAHHLIIDRCDVHGLPNGGDFWHGIFLNSAWSAIIDSYVSEWHGHGNDSQAIAGENGPGPFKIVNNFVEGATENIMFGGAPSYSPDLIPSDIEIRHNYIYKPLSWMEPNGPWIDKNLVELKIGRRVWYEGNILENNSGGYGQIGFGIVLTVRSNPNDPWTVISDVTFTNNLMKHSSGGINTLGWNDYYPSAQMQRVRFQNNVFTDFGWDPNFPGRLLAINSFPEDVQFDHNTVIPAGYPYLGTFFGSQTSGFIQTNTIVPVGIAGNGTGEGLNALQVYCPFGYSIAANVFAGVNGQNYPDGNFFPATMNDVGFVNYSGGDYHLSPSSPYKGKGTDGKDPGADIDAVESATCGVITGVPCSGTYPVITSPGTASATVGSPFSYQITATNDAFAFNASPLPPGLSVNTNSGLISGIPTVSGTFNVTLTASNFAGPGFANLVLTISGNALAAPVLNLPEFLAVNAQITAGYDGTDPVASYLWTFTPGNNPTPGSGSGGGNAGGGASSGSQQVQTLRTKNAQANLASLPLSLGQYTVTVQAFDSQGSSSPVTQAQTTLVPGDLSTVREYPNPWRSDRGYPQKVTFDNLTVNTTITIFTVSGHKVKGLPASSTSVTWDLTNDSGQMVASGIYLYVMKGDNGAKATGKLVIIK